MNVSLNLDAATAEARLQQLNKQCAERVQKELDTMFENGIKTPEDVIVAYEKIAEYTIYSGEEYKITIKENTIV